MNQGRTRNGNKHAKKHAGGKNKKKEFKVRVPTRTPGVPDTTVVDLKFRSDFRLVGGNPVALRWVVNGAYDADPALGGLKYQYFDVWSMFYSYNKVLSFDIDLTLVNVEVVPVNVTMCYTNTDPGVTGVSYPGYALQPYGFSTTIAGYSGGGAKLHYHKRLTPRHIVGDQLTNTSQNYVGTDASNPVDVAYFGLAVSDQITSLTNGLVGTLILTARIKFFDRKKLDDTSLYKRTGKTGVYTQTPAIVQAGKLIKEPTIEDGLVHGGNALAPPVQKIVL